MGGRLFLVVGPSGVGKDSILDAARARLAERAVFARRTITRDANAGGEDFDAVTPETFAAMQADSAFFASWQAHGLSYGLPASLLDHLAEGCNVVANVSRAALPHIVTAWSDTVIVAITAKPETVASRLAARGREDAADIARRLARAVPAPPPGIAVVTIDNDGALDEAVEAFVAAVSQPASPPRGE